MRKAAKSFAKSSNWVSLFGFHGKWLGLSLGSRPTASPNAFLDWETECSPTTIDATLSPFFNDALTFDHPLRHAIPRNG
jgi:hypothetical protein